MMRVGLLAVAWCVLGCSGSIDTPDVDLMHLHAVDCDQPGDPLPSLRDDFPRVFWAQDDTLRERLGTVLTRLQNATGVMLSVRPDGFGVVVQDLPNNVMGYMSGSRVTLDPQSLSDDSGVDAVLLHEIGHALGARHVDPEQGIMSRCLRSDGAQLLTGDDLEQICSAVSCAHLSPEI